MTDAPLLLTVCVGNLHRSPLAERLLQTRLGDAARVRSAGTQATEGTPLPEVTAGEIERLGGSTLDFASRLLTPQRVAEAALVIAMTTELRRDVLAQAPAALKRTFTLAELAVLLTDAPADVELPALLADAARRRGTVGAASDVPDPVRGGPQVHREVADTIAAYVDRVAPSLLAALHRTPR